MLTLTSPVETPFHRIRAGVKLALLCGFTLVLFRLGLTGLAVSLVLLVAMVAAGGAIFAAHAARMLWPLWPFAVLILVWHGWSAEWHAGFVILLRMTVAVLAANLVTMTTRLSDMIAVLETLTRPLVRLGVNPRVLALAIALVIRFIPVLGERNAALRLAWRARSARRPGWRLLIPATLATLDDADRVAEALRARGGAG